MSKLEQILASNGRAPAYRRKSGLARGLLLTLTLLLVAFVLLTQPPVRNAVESLLGQLPGI